MLFPPTNWTFGCLMLLLLSVFLGVRNCLDFYPNSPTMSNPFIPCGSFTVMGFSMFFQIYFPPFFQILAQPSPLGIPQPQPSPTIPGI